MIVAIYSAIRSSRISAMQANVQSRMLALENVRHRAEVRAVVSHDWIDVPWARKIADRDISSRA
jgi:hypothetical protein